ncbi:unnamed protein product [Cuscuta campestris]|uniref:feruloyl-CoA 6-hydroxylase n=1 Tax=Cuscuta campestris TaxID=132261 RepID=A0A484KRI6_9ASTE|nr:unnamed protein product [Cuscuta campestris]
MSGGIKVGHIDDVQELSATNPSHIPERFIRDISERPFSSSSSSSSDLKIPVIDLSKLTMEDKNNSPDFHSEMQKLTAACQDWGFFQVVKHGVEEGLVERMEKAAMEFFRLPVEEKQKYPMVPGTVQGYGQAFVFSEDQKLDWCNMFALGILPHSIRCPHLWPSKPPTFSETLEAYSKEVRELCKQVLKCIATSLGERENVFGEMFGAAVQAVRMNYYPPCPSPELVMGLSPHSDGSALTVLQQGLFGNSVGLEILKGSCWVPVRPLPNALVINIGDTIEVLTNGRYKSVEHRAVTHKEKDRLSIVTFYAPSYEIELGPLPGLVDQTHNPPKYKRYNHGDYSRHYVTNKLQGKKTLDFAKII